MPFDLSVGVVAGATGNPAIAAFAARTAPTDRPDVGYAMIFPSMTIGKNLVRPDRGDFAHPMTPTHCEGPHEDCRVQRPAL
jgi:hypothetical protein